MRSSDSGHLPALYEGLRVQLEMLSLWEATGEVIGGWKVGLTSGVNRDYMGVGFRPFGYVLGSRVFASGATVSRSRIQVCQIEPEICLTLGASLGGPHVEVDEARGAVREVSPAFEINELRRSMADSPSSISIADCLSNWGIVAGSGVPVSDSDLTQTEVVLKRNQEVISSTIPGSAMDDPYVSLANLCATLDLFGLSLQPGQKVITGAFSRDVVTDGGSWSADFSGIGTVEVTFD